MSRFKVFALAAALALGSLTMATEASAAHGGHFGHGFAGHGFAGHGFGFHHGFGFRRGFGFHRGFGFGFAPYYYGYYPYEGCWRWRRVWTPFGWRLHRVNVCYYPYY